MKPLFEIPELFTLNGDPFNGIIEHFETGHNCTAGCQEGCCAGCQSGTGKGDWADPES